MASEQSGTKTAQAKEQSWPGGYNLPIISTFVVKADLPNRSNYLWRRWRIRLLLEPERAEFDAGVLEGVARLWKCGGKGMMGGSDLLPEMTCS